MRHDVFNTAQLTNIIMMGFHDIKSSGIYRIVYMFFSTFITFYVEYLFQNTEKISSLFKTLFITSNSMKFQMTITETSSDCYVKASEATKALLYIIDKRAQYLDGVRHMKEVYMKSFLCYVDKVQKTQNIIDQKNSFALEKDIYCNIDISTETNDKSKIRTISVKLSTRSGINKIKSFVKSCVDEHHNDMQDKLHEKKNIYLLTSNTDTERCDYLSYTQVEFASNKSFSNMYFEEKDTLLERIDYFMNNKQKYDQVGMPYTLGMLFHGLPGTGKTSVIKAIANYMNRHIIIIPTHLVTDNETLVKIFCDNSFNDCKIPMDKRLYVFEEIDCGSWSNIVCARNNEDTFQQQVILVEKMVSTDVTEIPMSRRKEIEKQKVIKTPLTLGNILEMLDGMIETPGRVIIFTSNYPNKLDSALLRPGRISVKMEFSKLSKKNIADMYKLWFNQDLPQEVYQSMKENTFTQAELGELFIMNYNNQENLLKALQSSF